MKDTRGRGGVALSRLYAETCPEKPPVSSPQLQTQPFKEAVPIVADISGSIVLGRYSEGSSTGGELHDGRKRRQYTGDRTASVFESGLRSIPPRSRYIWGPEGTVLGDHSKKAFGSLNDASVDGDLVSLLAELASYVSQFLPLTAYVTVGKFSCVVVLSDFFFNRGIGDFLVVLPPQAYLHRGIICSLRSALSTWFHFIDAKQQQPGNKINGTNVRPSSAFDHVSVDLGHEAGRQNIQDAFPFMESRKHDSWSDLFFVQAGAQPPYFLTNNPKTPDRASIAKVGPTWAELEEIARPVFITDPGTKR